jgi:hypothetical protein
MYFILSLNIILLIKGDITTPCCNVHEDIFDKLGFIITEKYLCIVIELS